MIEFASTNPLYRSKSNQKFSFSKSPRKSIDVAVRAVYCDQYYDLPSSVSMTNMDAKKTPGFGIGDKQSKERIKTYLMDMPPPNQYNLASTFERNRTHNKGSSFGMTHEIYRQVYNECLPEKKGWTEPGMYNIKSFVDINKHDGRKMTFGLRLEGSPSKTPGPGHYRDDEKEGMNEYGTYSNGKNKNSKSRKFSKDKRRTFMDSKENIQIELNNKLAHFKPEKYC